MNYVVTLSLCVYFLMMAAKAYSQDEILVARENTQTLASLATIDKRYSNIALVANANQNYVGFFELDDKEIALSVVGASEAPIQLAGKLSFFKAQIEKSEAEKLQRYLKVVGVKGSEIAGLVNELTRGVNGSRECKGKKSDCLIFAPEFTTVVDFYNSSLRLFIPSEQFATTEQKIVLESVDESLLVSSWYGSFSYTDVFSYFLRSENTYGLGDGYLRYDFNASDYSQDIGQFNYNYDAAHYSATAGIIANAGRLGVAGQNSLMNERFVGAEISNQKRLEIKNFAARSVDFFSPSEGVLSVYNPQRELIYQSNILAGRNRIPYSALPYGNYAVEYEVTNNDDVVFSGNNFVSNSDAFDASERSFYGRLGAKEQSNTDDKDSLVFDTGLSIPLYQQQSAIGSVSLVEEEWFAGVGYYANIDDYRLSVKYSLGQRASRINADVYSNLFNLSLTNTDVDDARQESYLGNQDSLLISGGMNQSFGLFSLGLSASYNELGEDDYLSYNVNANYSFRNGVSLYASYSGSDNQNNVNFGLSIPLSTQTHYSGTYTQNNGRGEFSNQLSTNVRLNDELSFNGGVSHRYMNDDDLSSQQHNGIDVYANGSYRHDAFNSSAGIRRQKEGMVTYNGSFSTTAYVTANRAYFKETRSGSTSAIEVNGLDEALEGKVKIHDKVSGRKVTQAIANHTLIEMKPYSQVVVDYQFDNDEFALESADMERNTTVNMLPGKIHYLNVKQQPIGNVLIVSNSLDTDGIVCTGQACVNSSDVNGKVLKFRVKPGRQFAIHRYGEMCFTGQVEQGKTNIGVCQSEPLAGISVQ
ncbi:TcfC E-set like domain-containing protein [Vibrio scophthalmi]|uniref:Pilus assembly protein E-set like domain-containing protein n=1 Tax=Vibrio scophthalmi TaxID=45658 RepID=A0A1E3WND0_9VIBR|nr:TcfC E-set like domain-containing protein [Vibrio scophthalmi]ODS11276.1 hypothetical protein VSF3289_01541 [Vibrio scophthalmi]